MNAGIWIALAAIVVGYLGGSHLLMLFRTPKLHPSDAALTEQMSRATIPLSDATTVGRLWVGFNASHSLGALGFGVTYAYLGLAEPTALFATPVLSVVGLAYLLAMLGTSLRYWFLLPTLGISLATLIFATGAVLGVSG